MLTLILVGGVLVSWLIRRIVAGRADRGRLEVVAYINRHYPSDSHQEY